MRSLAIAFWYVVFATLATSQQSTTEPNGYTPQDPDRAQIQSVLKAYEDAYNHRDLEALVAIWPNLRNQQKDFDKVQWHLKDDPNVFSEKMSVEPTDWKVGKDQATVSAKRSEVWVKLQSRSEIGVGDVRSETGQLPDPAPALSKRVVKKSDTVTFALQKQADRWVIVSLSGKK